MPLAKVKLLSLIQLMNDEDAEILLNYIYAHFQITLKSDWKTIEEVAPDDFDMAMLQDITTNPECHQFVSQAELYKELGL